MAGRRVAPLTEITKSQVPRIKNLGRGGAPNDLSFDYDVNMRPPQIQREVTCHLLYRIRSGFEGKISPECPNTVIICQNMLN